MNLVLIFIAVFPVMHTPPSVPARIGDAPMIDSTQIYYATQDLEALQDLCRRTQDREVSLLCRYRLYPLTQDPAYLENLPALLENASARELAVLSGLWGYRVATAPVYKIPRYGKHTTRLLDDAKAINPLEPFVLLIDGQSLLFRPSIFGGDKREALKQFKKLSDILKSTTFSEISQMEADVWVWYTLDKLDDENAPRFRSTLLTQNPPPLYKAFLLDPP